MQDDGHKIVISHTEEGDKFITLYFSVPKDCYIFGKRAYDKLMNRSDFKYKDIQAKNFGHDDPNNPLSFHTDGDAGKRYGASKCKHIHFRYPHKPGKAEWNYLYKHLNDKELNIFLPKDIPHRYVKKVFTTMTDIFNPNLEFDKNGDPILNNEDK